MSRPKTLVLIMHVKQIAVCNMCGIRFRVQELNKRLTFKMIYNVKGHLEKRGIFVYSNLPQQSVESMTQTIRICSTCYSVAIAEYDLVETECKLAQIQGIPATADTILDCGARKRGEENTDIMDAFLYQWRVMIHLESLSDIPGTFLRSDAGYSVQYKVFDYSTSFPICLSGTGPAAGTMRPGLPVSVIMACRTATHQDG